MTRLANLGTAYTLARAKAVVRRDGYWFRWTLVTNYGESVTWDKPATGTEKTKTAAQTAGNKAAAEYNLEQGGKRTPWKRKNVKRGSPKNKISLWTGI